MHYWNKVHLAGLLAAHYGLSHYLEITTSETGQRYGEARDLHFESCRRLVYLCTGDTPDGLPIDFFSSTEDIAQPLQQLRESNLPTEIVLVDAHHTYECAARDLRVAFDLVVPGGVLVVHDCLPPSASVAAPEYHSGEWCGVTYKAFLDFVLGNPALNYITVDADYGCGIVRKSKTPVDKIKNQLRAVRQRTLRQEWTSLGQDYDRTFAMLQSRPVELLRLGGLSNLQRYLRSGLR